MADKQKPPEKVEILPGGASMCCEVLAQLHNSILERLSVRKKSCIVQSPPAEGSILDRALHWRRRGLLAI